MNGRQRNATNAKYGERKTTRIMRATAPHVTSGSGLIKFQADGFLFGRVYVAIHRLKIVFAHADSAARRGKIFVVSLQWAFAHKTD